jgi:hypothetical protein
MPCGTKKKTGATGLEGMKVDELKEHVKTAYPYLTKVKNMKRKELCELLEKDCPNLGGLVNKQNSCYLDSTLVGLFHAVNPYVRKYIFDKNLEYTDPELQESSLAIQKMLRGVYGAINKGNKGACTSLRNAFHKFDKRSASLGARLETLDWKTSQLEPADVIKILIRVFDIPSNCKYNIKRYTLVKKRKVFINEEDVNTTFADPIISSDLLYGKKHFDLKKYIPQEKNKVVFDNDNKWKPFPDTDPDIQYKHKITVKTYRKASMFSVHISRAFGDEKIKTPVVPMMTLKLKENTRPLHLRSIIVHHGDDPESGHYTCYIRCQRHWYHYDDLAFNKLQLVGDHDKMFKMNKYYVLKNMSDLIFW